MPKTAQLTQAEIALTGTLLILQGFKSICLDGCLQDRLTASAMGQFRGTQ